MANDLLKKCDVDESVIAAAADAAVRLVVREPGHHNDTTENSEQFLVNAVRRGVPGLIGVGSYDAAKAGIRVAVERGDIKWRSPGDGLMENMDGYYPVDR